MTCAPGTRGDLVFLADVAPYRGSDGTPRPAGVHRSLGAAGLAFAQVASMCNFGYRAYTSVLDLGEDVLEQARLLVLYTIGETPWSARQREVVERRARGGQLGLLGVHSATDSAYKWPMFGELMGARFDGHPVTGDLAIKKVATPHPATDHLPSPWRVREELYVFRELSPHARVLLGVDFPPAGHGPGTSVLPLCWCIEDGPVRTFYTVIGHFLGTYEDPAYIQHLVGAVQWVCSEA